MRYYKYARVIKSLIPLTYFLCPLEIELWIELLVMRHNQVSWILDGVHNNNLIDMDAENQEKIVFIMEWGGLLSSCYLWCLDSKEHWSTSLYHHGYYWGPSCCHSWKCSWTYLRLWAHKWQLMTLNLVFGDIYFNPTICFFNVSRRILLGHIINKGGHALDLSKAKAILEAPAPLTRRAWPIYLVRYNGIAVVFDTWSQNVWKRPPKDIH